MKILIIEDEVQAGWDLQQSIQLISTQYQVLKILDSVRAAVEWLTSNNQPDLILSDIQLGDGLVFDVFDKVTVSCPIIFCTAYDEYVLQAFKVNGIDYLLKPINESELIKSLQKLELLSHSLSKNNNTEALAKAVGDILRQQSSYKNSFLIPYRDKMIPVSTDQIAYFSVTDSGGEVYTTDGKSFSHTFTLDSLESQLDPQLFFRANRQYLVAVHAIKEIEQFIERKLLIHLKPPCKQTIVVSKAKASAFLNWMEER
jgi:two-component system, LytTR family, response regulator